MRSKYKGLNSLGSFGGDSHTNERGKNKVGPSLGDESQMGAGKLFPRDDLIAVKGAGADPGSQCPRRGRSWGTECHLTADSPVAKGRSYPRGIRPVGTPLL